MTEISHTHLHEGGTLITNFAGSSRPAIEQAIEEYGDPNLVINDQGYSRLGHLILGYNSLHYLGPAPPTAKTAILFAMLNELERSEGMEISPFPKKSLDLSRFWRIVERIEKEQLV